MLNTGTAKEGIIKRELGRVEVNFELAPILLNLLYNAGFEVVVCPVRDDRGIVFCDEITVYKTERGV